MIRILQIISAIATLGIGMYALIKPKTIYQFTGLKATGVRGITEIRSIFGAVFIALGIGTILMNAYLFLGIIYIAVGVVRLISMVFIDKSTAENSNWISFIAEMIMGLILIL